MRLTLEYVAVKGQTSGKGSIAGKGQEESGKCLPRGLGARGCTKRQEQWGRGGLDHWKHGLRCHSCG